MNEHSCQVCPWGRSGCAHHLSSIGSCSSSYSLLTGSPQMSEQLEQLLLQLGEDSQGKFRLFLRNLSSDCQRCSRMTNSLIIAMDITAVLAIISAECLPWRAQTHLVVVRCFGLVCFCSLTQISWVCNKVISIFLITL